MRHAAYSSRARYTGTAIGLHWAIALLMVAAFGLGMVMTDIPGFSPTKLRYYAWHKWLGVTVFILAVVRLSWRVTHPVPPLPATLPVWQRRASHGLHHLLYLLMFAVPLSGYAYSMAAGVPVVYLGVLPLPILMGPDEAWKAVLKLVHVSLNYSLAGLVGLHVLAALKHQFVDRDGIVRRMLPWG